MAEPGPSILLVDDDAVFRNRLARALVTRGCEVRAAGDANEALRLADEESPEYAVLDLRMPGVGGLDLLRRLKAIDPATVILLLTGYGSIATAVEALREGAVHYLTKPADADQILVALGCASTDGLPAPARDATPSLARVEWEHLQRVVADSEGNLSEAARRLGLHRRSLQRKLARRPPDR
jgi:two-component system, response regulator RegA